jgi:hypothetical protein
MRILKLLRMLRLLKILRLMSNSRMIDKLQQLIGPSARRLIRLCLAAMAILHITACLFYFVAYLEDSSTHTWLYAMQMQDADL